MDIRTVESFLGPLDKIGVAEPALDLYSERIGRYEQLDDIDPAIRNFELPNSDVKGEVLIPFIHSEYLTGQLYLFITHAFQTRGYKPILASCHGVLPHCFRREVHDDSEGMCVNCRHKSDAHMDAYGFEPTTMVEYIPDGFYPDLPADDGELRSYSYRSVDVSRYALATTRRNLRKFSIDLNVPEDREAFIQNLQAAVYLAEFTHQVIDARDIVATVGNHPAYNYAGVLLAAAESRDVPAVSYAGGYLRKDSIIFGNQSNRKGFTLFSDHERTVEFIQDELDAEQRQQVEKYMAGRRDGSTIRELNDYTRGADTGLDIDSDGPIVGMFTNLIWDGSLSDCAITFDSPLDWVKQTVEGMAEFPDITLVVKPHPAEAHRGTEESVADWAGANVTIPDNVHFLEADTDVSPYEVFPTLDLGLVYNSTVGLEMLYEGVPVVVSGDTHYRELGFTYDPATPSEYFDLLDTLDELTLTESQQRLVERYAYFLLVERHIPVDGVDNIKNIRHLSHEEIKNSEALDHAVERVLADDPAMVRPQ